MDDVATNLDAEGTTNRSRVGLQRIGGTNDFATLGDNRVTFKGNGHDRATGEVLDQGGKESLGGEVGVVGLSQFFGDVHELETAEGVAFGHEAFQNGGDEVALYAIGLDHDESGLLC